MNGITKIGIWGLTLFTVLLMGSLESYGATPQTTPDSLVYSLYFRQGGSLLMKDYRDNKQALSAIRAAFTPENAANIVKVNIIGTTSPEGTVETNVQLSQKRAQAVRNYILWQWGIKNKSLIEITKQSNCLSAWILAATKASDMPKQTESLKILHSNASIPTKWANLQRLSTDAAKYMERHIFPYLRSAMTVIIYKHKPTEITEITEPGELAEPTNLQIDAKTNTPKIDTIKTNTIKIDTNKPDTNKIVTEKAAQDTIKLVETSSKNIVETISTPDKATENTPDKTTENTTKQSDNSIVPHKKAKCKENYRFGIKTNLLQGSVAFAPNLGFEYAINNKTTIELTGALNHWGLNGSSTNNKKLAHWILQSEYRYWLKKSFCGHFFGAHALGGKYNISGHTLPNLFLGGDLMESQYRYDGWMAGAGVSYGYHLRFAKHWGVEFNIGVGVAHLRYDKYDCVRCGRKLNTENKTYFGPTKAGISLIYNFNTKNLK